MKDYFTIVLPRVLVGGLAFASIVALMYYFSLYVLYALLSVIVSAIVVGFSYLLGGLIFTILRTK